MTDHNDAKPPQPIERPGFMTLTELIRRLEEDPARAKRLQAARVRLRERLKALGLHGDCKGTNPPSAT